MKRFSVISVGLLLAASSQSFGDCFPANNLANEDMTFLTSMTEKDFNQAIDEVLAVYNPAVGSHGATLTVNRLWTDATVNANAGQTDATHWLLNMYGGLARRPEITRDGFQLVVCHELGHQLGGFPFKDNDNTAHGFAAAEGQADYFATQECAHRLWRSQGTVNAQAAKAVNVTAKASCDKSWKSVTDRNVCYRTANAGLSLATLLATLESSSTPNFAKKDPSVVTATDINHPKAQCRLDTYLAGNICTKAFDLSKIPGRHNPAGQMSLDAEKEEATTSCTKTSGFSVGLRPGCWFKARL